MKFKNDKIFGTIIDRSTYANGDIIEYITDNILLAYENVYPGPIISGDHKTPNEWSYDIDQTTYFNGRIAATHDFGHSNRPLYESIGSTVQRPDAVEDWQRDLAYNATLSKIYDKIRGTLDLSIALAERKQTTDMLRKTLTPKRITQIGRNLQRMLAYRRKILDRKKRFGYEYSDESQMTWRDGFTIPADLWLEFKYGWEPLVSDVYNTAELLTHNVQSNLSISERTRFNMPTEKSVGSPVPGLDAHAKGRGFSSCTIKLNLRTEIDPTHVSRFTSLNPVSIAWELMPYSFVVDWFLDVGSYLRDTENALLYRNSVHSVTVSELYMHDYAYTAKQKVVESGILKEADLNAKLNLIKFQRSIGATSLFPRAPKIRAQLGSSRLFSAASLLAQFLKK